MSFRSWVFAVALGLAIFLSGQVQSQTAVEDQPRQEESATNAYGHSERQHRQTTDLASSLEGIEAAIRDLIAEEDKIGAQAQKDRENRDLQAQESMALWAKWMFYATAATVLLTFAALIAIIRTLHHTRRAADYTRDMLGEAERATNAALNSVDTTRDIGEKQVRPWVVVESVELEIRDNQIRHVDGRDDMVSVLFVRPEVKVSGQSPAQKVCVSMTGGVKVDPGVAFGIDDSDKFDFVTPANYPNVSLPHGGRTKKFVSMEIYGSDLSGLGVYHDIVYFFDVRYTSPITGKTHHTTAGIRVERMPGENGKSVPCSRFLPDYGIMT